MRQCYRTSAPPARSNGSYLANSYRRNQGQYQYAEGLEMQGPAYFGSLGCYLGKYLGKGFSVESGIVYEIKQFQTGYDTTLIPPERISQRFSYRYLSFPFYANKELKIHPWLLLSPSLGLTVDYPYAVKQYWSRESTPYRAGTGYVLENGGPGGALGLSAVVRMKIDFVFKSSDIHIGIVPFYSYSYKSMIDAYTLNTIHLYDYGLTFLLSIPFHLF